jgi:hypothetical protein
MLHPRSPLRPSHCFALPTGGRPLISLFVASIQPYLPPLIEYRQAPTAFFMANLLSKFITDRLITPAVQAQLPHMQKDTTAFAVGAWPEQNTDLTHTLG